MKNTVIVTGASRGLGLACVKELVEKNYNVIGISRSQPEDSIYKNTLVKHFQADVSQESDFKAVIQYLQENKTSVTGIVNNAGVLDPMQSLVDCDAQEWKNHLSINLYGSFLALKYFIPQLDKNKQCHVINISSGAAHSPYAGWSAYCAGKAGLNQITRVLALELPPSIEVVSLAPGVVDTEMQDQIRATDDKDFPARSKFEELKNNAALLPAQIPAQVVAWLIERNANNYHGQVLDIRDPEFQKAHQKF